jgi:hypothetical protein
MGEGVGMGKPESAQRRRAGLLVGLLSFLLLPYWVVIWNQGTATAWTVLALAVVAPVVGHGAHALVFGRAVHATKDQPTLFAALAAPFLGVAGAVIWAGLAHALDLDRYAISWGMVAAFAWAALAVGIALGLELSHPGAVRTKALWLRAPVAAAPGALLVGLMVALAGTYGPPGPVIVLFGYGLAPLVLVGTAAAGLTWVARAPSVQALRQAGLDALAGAGAQRAEAHAADSGAAATPTPRHGVHAYHKASAAVLLMLVSPLVVFLVFALFGLSAFVLMQLLGIVFNGRAGEAFAVVVVFPVVVAAAVVSGIVLLGQAAAWLAFVHRSSKPSQPTLLATVLAVYLVVLAGFLDVQDWSPLWVLGGVLFACSTLACLNGLASVRTHVSLRDARLWAAAVLAGLPGTVVGLFCLSLLAGPSHRIVLMGASATVESLWWAPLAIGLALALGLRLADALLLPKGPSPSQTREDPHF